MVQYLIRIQSYSQLTPVTKQGSVLASKLSPHIQLISRANPRLTNEMLPVHLHVQITLRATRLPTFHVRFPTYVSSLPVHLHVQTTLQNQNYLHFHVGLICTPAEYTWQQVRDALGRTPQPQRDSHRPWAIPTKLSKSPRYNMDKTNYKNNLQQSRAASVAG